MLVHPLSDPLIHCLLKNLDLPWDWNDIVSECEGDGDNKKM